MPEAEAAQDAIQFHPSTPILTVADLNVSLEYYALKLGFKADFIQSGMIASVSRGKCHLFLVERDQGHPGAWVWIGVSDSAQLHEEFKASGAKIRVPPSNRPWAYEMQVEDPDGNVLRFGSDPKPGEAQGEWIDMEGIPWTPLVQGRWKRTSQLTAADRAAQEAGRATTPEEVRSALEKSVALWRESSHHSDGKDSETNLELAIALRTLGQFERKAGDLERAKTLYEESIALLRQNLLSGALLSDALRSGAKQAAHLADAVGRLGDIHHRAKRTAAAEECYAEALALYREEGKLLRPASLRNLDVGNVLRRMAILKEEASDDASARDLWQQAYESYARTGYQPALAESAAWVARLLHRTDDKKSAQEWLSKAQAAAEQCEDGESGENETKSHVEKVRAEIAG